MTKRPADRGPEYRAAENLIAAALKRDAKAVEVIARRLDAKQCSEVFGTVAWLHGALGVHVSPAMVTGDRLANRFLQAIGLAPTPGPDSAVGAVVAVGGMPATDAAPAPPAGIAWALERAPDNGEQGTHVRLLQQELGRAGYGVTVDGRVGPRTLEALIRYQLDHPRKDPQ